MTKDEIQKVRDALWLPENSTDEEFNQMNEALAILDAALAAPEPQPVAAQVRFRIIKVDHPFYDPKKGWSIWQETSMRNVKLDMHHVDNAGYETEYRYLYTAPVAAPDDAIDWEGIAADQAMTIAMMKVDYQQLQTLVTSQGVRMMEQEDWQKDAARYYWLRDSSHWPAKFGDNGDFAPLSGAELDAAIDAAMQGEKP